MLVLSTNETYLVIHERTFKGEFAGNRNCSMSKHEQEPRNLLMTNHLEPQDDEAEGILIAHNRKQR